MLTDFTPQDRAVIVEDDDRRLPFSFDDSCERVSEGIYETNFLFEEFIRPLIAEREPFSGFMRKYFEDTRRFYEADDYDNPEFKALQETFHANMEDTRFPKEYGVCDYPEQIVEKFPALVTDERRFVITVKEIRKEDQGEMGWRWHKWGPYIGDKEPVAEYLADEPEIDSVFIYHIYNLKSHD